MVASVSKLSPAIGPVSVRPLTALTSIRVLIADDHQLVRQGYCALLSRAPDICIVGEARDGLEAVENADKLRPDVVLLDLQMPRMGGLSAIDKLNTRSTRLLIVSMQADASVILQALEHGARGFLSKDDSFDELVQAIRVIHGDQVYLGKKIKSILEQNEMENSR